MKTIFFLALMIIGSLSAQAAGEHAPTDAEIRKQLLGLWRSPRHEYEYRANGMIYMLPADSDSTTAPWSVKNGCFYQNQDAYAIVTLNDKKFVYRPLADKNGPTYVLVRITRKMVGQPYNR